MHIPSQFVRKLIQPTGYAVDRAETRNGRPDYCSVAAHGRMSSRDAPNSEADGDPLAGGLDRVPGKVGVAVGRLDLVVAEMPDDHRQAFTHGELPRARG